MNRADELAAQAGEAARKGDSVTAAAAARDALALEPDHAVALRHLAVALLQAGDAAGARRTAARAVAMAPDDGATLEVLGAALVGGGELAAARAVFTRAGALAPGRAEPCFNVGVLAEAQGDFEAAVAAHREAIARRPGFPQARLGLARALQELDRPAEAIAAWRDVLADDPDDASARHMIDALAGADRAAPPPGFVRAVFDAYAGRFDQHLVEHLQYRGPALLAAILGDARFGRALDLGCGTGLVGAALRDRCAHLDGVDLSPGMLARAAARGVYDQLTDADVVEHLAAGGEPYDLIVAGDVLGYLGDLAPLFAAVPGRLAPGGVFAFTVERGDGDSCRLQPTGRWRHGPAYVERVAAAAGLAIRTAAAASLRIDLEGEVAGLLYVLARASLTGSAAGSCG